MNQALGSSGLYGTEFMTIWKILTMTSVGAENKFEC